MKSFNDEAGTPWTATAREENTPRHHGRWYLVFETDGASLPMPEVRWQTRATAERTLRTMSTFELLRRLHIVRERALLEVGASPESGAQPTDERKRSSARAG
jgi:hypothetical protein